ncbi:hypothetical protein ACQKEG_14520, partial [Klebsiella quasipneumoniae]
CGLAAINADDIWYFASGGAQTIFIGGGVVERPGFLTLLRQHLAWFGIADYLDTVSHGNDAGLIGAVYHFNQHYRSPGDDRP